MSKIEWRKKKEKHHTLGHADPRVCSVNKKNRGGGKQTPCSVTLIHESFDYHARFRFSDKADECAYDLRFVPPND